MSCEDESVFAIETHKQHPFESRLRGVDFTGKLEDDETLEPSDEMPLTVTVSPEGPTLSDEAVNTSIFKNGRRINVAVGKGVLVRVANVTAGVDYEITASCGTNHGNLVTLICRLEGQGSELT